MTLEHQLNKLGVLQVGDIKKVIGDIEDHKYDSQKVLESIDNELLSYKELLEQKLNVICGNIQMLGNSIVELCSLGADISKRMDMETGYCPNKQIKVKFYEEYGRKRKEYPVLELTVGPPFVDIKFTFDSVLRSVTGISSEPHSKFGCELHVEAKTLYDFVDQCASQTISYLKERRAEPDYIWLPFVLNLVPDLVREVYADIKEKHNKRLQDIGSYSERLDLLDIPEF